MIGWRRGWRSPRPPEGVAPGADAPAAEVVAGPPDVEGADDLDAVVAAVLTLAPEALGGGGADRVCGREA